MITNLPELLDTTTKERLSKAIAEADDIVITCHVSPDGDALGSSLGMLSVLQALGKKAVVITPDAPPRQLSFMPGLSSIVIASYNPQKARHHIDRADLIFCLDFNDFKRLDKIGGLIERSKAAKVMIDHHLDPKPIADIVVSHPEISSTSVLVYRVLHQLGMIDNIDTNGASCIFTGMMTDTGNFSYNSNDPTLYPIVGDLVARGVDKDAIYRSVFNTASESRVRIQGYALYRKLELFPAYKTALITLTMEELEEFGYEKGDTESLVNVPLSIPGIECSIFMRQDRPDYVKISTRSKGDFPVNSACERYFGGGGHINAAGGEWNGTLSEAVDRLLHIMSRNLYPWGPDRAEQ